MRKEKGAWTCEYGAGASVEVRLNNGDVIRTLNGQPMTTLDQPRWKLGNRQWASGRVYSKS
jgi:hypothetical protein